MRIYRGLQWNDTGERGLFHWRWLMTVQQNERALFYRRWRYTILQCGDRSCLLRWSRHLPIKSRIFTASSSLIKRIKTKIDTNTNTSMSRDKSNTRTHYRTRARSLESYHCIVLSLTNWLTHPVTFSRLVWCDPGVWRCQLKTFWDCSCADVDDEDRVGNSLLQIWKLRFGHKAKRLFRLWARGLVKILVEVEVQARFEAGVCDNHRVRYAFGKVCILISKTFLYVHFQKYSMT